MRSALCAALLFLMGLGPTPAAMPDTQCMDRVLQAKLLSSRLTAALNDYRAARIELESAKDAGDPLGVKAVLTAMISTIGLTIELYDEVADLYAADLGRCLPNPAESIAEAKAAAAAARREREAFRAQLPNVQP